MFSWVRLTDEAVEITRDAQHGAMCRAHELLCDRPELDVPAASGAVATDDDQARAHLRSDVVELLPGRPTTQDAGDLDVGVVVSRDDLGQGLAASTHARFVCVQLADMNDRDSGAHGASEPDRQLESMVRARAEIGAGHELSKRLHGLSMPAAPVQCCLISVGSEPAASNPRWTRPLKRSRGRRRAALFALERANR